MKFVVQPDQSSLTNELLFRVYNALADKVLSITNRAYSVEALGAGFNANDTTVNGDFSLQIQKGGRVVCTIFRIDAATLKTDRDLPDTIKEIALVVFRRYAIYPDAS